MEQPIFHSKFVGANLPDVTVSRLETELARRTAAGRQTSRAKLLVEAIDRAFPLPGEEGIKTLGSATTA
jgi:hypothetical protein